MSLSLAFKGCYLPYAKYLQIPKLPVFSINVVHSDEPVTGCFHVCNATGVFCGPSLVLWWQKKSCSVACCLSADQVAQVHHVSTARSPQLGCFSSRNAPAVVCNWDSGYSLMKAVDVGLGLEVDTKQRETPKSGGLDYLLLVFRKIFRFYALSLKLFSVDCIAPLGQSY